MTKFAARVLGVSTMTSALAMAALGCSSSASSPATLQNKWIFIASDGNSGTGLNINSDGTYVLVRLSAVSSNRFNAQEELGTVAVSGNTVTFAPTSSSCRYASDPPYSATYDVHGDELTLALSFGVVVLKLNQQSGSGSSTGLIVTNGCFQDDETFVPTPISPVASCVAKPGDRCSATSACCRGTTCVSDGVCAATCKSNADCNSGCCPLATSSEGLRGCGPAAACK